MYCEKKSRLGLSFQTGVSLLGIFTLCLFTLSSQYSVAQSVVTDGGTNTSVTVSSDGLITVGLAPANSASISHNTFTNFSVQSAGVNLDNSAVAASTILNEVTSTNKTLINGPLTVIGARADVIIANPNGIAVNGGRFQNTGNLALTTGTVNVDTSGVVTSTVNTGRIVVGQDGLSGTMDELALISKSLRLLGGISYDLPSDQSHVNVITGSSVTTIDRDRGGLGVDGANALPWALATAGTGDANGNLIVDIANTGSISAGRISLTVTDTGAGVRIAGDHMAAAGGFRLTSTGHLEMADTRVTAKGSVIVSAASVDLASAEDARTEIRSNESGVVLIANAGSVALGQSSVSGVTTASGTFASDGGVTVRASENITTTGTEQNRAFVSSTIGEDSDAVANSNVVFVAGGYIDLSGLDFVTTDDVRMIAQGAVTLNDVNADVGKDFRLFSNAAVSFDATRVTSFGDMRIEAASLRFGADDPSQARTEVKFTNGGMILKANEGDLLNYGSLLQGRTTTSGDSDSKGGVSIDAAGDFVNKSLSVARLAVAFGELDNLHVRTGGTVFNYTGRLFSNDQVDLVAQGDILNETQFTTSGDEYIVEHVKGGRFAGSLFLRRKSSTYVYGDLGEQSILGEQAFIFGVGNVRLKANNITNIGAEITGARIRIDAEDEFTTLARQVGSYSFSQTCKWFCKTSAYSSVRTIGGNVSASAKLEIGAGVKVSSFGGQLSGSDGIVITSPLTQVTPLFSAELIERPGGVGTLFNSNTGYVVAQYKYGSLTAGNGNIKINGDADLGEAFVFSNEELEITGTTIETVLPAILQPFQRRPIGLLWNVF